MGHLSQLGVMVNSIKRLLDTLRPKIETQLKTWAAYLPEGAVQGGAVVGERHNEVTIELRAKYKNYLHALVEKLAENVSSHNNLMSFNRVQFTVWPTCTSTVYIYYYVLVGYRHVCRILLN